ncbi:tRNA (adenosine(37)-N6)-threonylcarbamoyltransferase complex ATPase subunit type 1 TsaE [Croceimicrobium sp.]|uniref:tRNA (adenosine(37)-N6)-threonylcarbamoyltransferase complex ATPase subunit type 1 TsaE n=1 Tax=Croceimicrobium sp. TaxID=2828340 RepID=UPI003BA90700
MADWNHEGFKQADLPEVARTILKNLEEPLVLFKGDLGAGKTTLIKELCKQLGVLDEVNSPTFSLVNEYQGAKGEQIFHFDWYRLEDESEAWDMGWEDYLERGDYLFMEWPEKISTLIPPDFALIEIEVTSAESRIIRLSHHHE